MTIEALIAGIAVHAPGLSGWDAGLPVLRGEAAWSDAPLALPPPSVLPANERRRTSRLVRLMMLSAGDAVAMSGISPSRLRGVFGSSSGDGDTVCGILETLARDEPISPTAFHNSVHNAPAGYWSIAQSSMQPVTCVGGYNDTFPASLLKALAELHAEAEPVLMCVADLPLPPPLHALRPLNAGMAVSFVLLPGDEEGHAVARLRLIGFDRSGRDASRSSVASPPVVSDNPAGKAWDLITSIALGRVGPLSIPYLDGVLRLELLPC